MAPAARRPRAALALLLALAALAPAWAARNASRAAGRGWPALPESGGPQRALGPSHAPQAANNGTKPRGRPAASAAPAGSRLDPPGRGPAAATEPAPAATAAGVFPGAGKPAAPFPTGPGDGAEAAPCAGCPGQGDGVDALPPGAGPDSGATPRVPAGDELGDATRSPEEPGSGQVPPGAGHRGVLEGLTTAPPEPPEPAAAPGAGLSTDSAESELLLAAGGQAARWPPAPGAPTRDSQPLERWPAASSPAPAQGAGGRTDLAWLDTEAPITAALGTAEPPAGQTVAEILDGDYYELLEGGEGPAGGRAAGGAATPWGLHELYDDFTPFDEADFYPTTSFYTDGDEEGEEDDLEEEEEEEEEEAGGLEDENGRRPPTPALPGGPTVGQEPRPTGRRDAVPPPPAVVSGGRPAAPGPERGLPAAGPGLENGTECRSGYVRHNGSCRSVCDLVPSYCHNGGQCYLVESHGAFCRCTAQAYTWHKGPRCEAVVTDFQVLCVAVGSAALVLLLLFMLTVFFAKKLYLLKTENSKLRQTKYRSPSELHNDNFSLSTIAEGSHPNDEPGAAHKPQESPRRCGKDEEPEGGKGRRDGAQANCPQSEAA
ncbi:chondroitin sulfate proteoglycan 5 [Struthio camelus]|uniref:chondroitin sulfate proteoglycan 5 n=1 Tax=Struthio camelus TaxID=8801 RepID=UPI0036042E47